MPHDILVAIVRKADPADIKALHRTCRAWHYAVRCGTIALTPSAKHCKFPRLRECFPRVRMGPPPSPSHDLCALMHVRMGCTITKLPMSPK